MPLEVKQLDCPNCGAALNVKNAARSHSIVCQQCSSQLDLSEPPYYILGMNRQPAPAPRTPFQLGMRGSIEDDVYEIIGRIHYYEDSESSWDEWLLLSEQGRYRWISDSDDGVRIWDPFTPTEPVDPESVKEGGRIAPEGISAIINEKGSAEIRYLEGELTWRARIGDQMSYIDAISPDRTYSIEWTPNEIEFYRGRAITNSELKAAFGITSPTKRNVTLSPAFVFVALVIVIVCFIICTYIIFSNDDGIGGGGFFFVPGGGGISSDGGYRGSGGSSGGGK